ncbi:MAG: 2-isopropylmalate synthase (EC [uncultured Sulfurovum sp.]|uniref:2-isopropylmalate synthase n=1 Tax=uncultured Sulfurovum sp. TaxID=269237 RepID=A0A6S6SA19_9BACT|nr:MAG: 2-isopropylmalate synthase (EC [uncultured Sulfurovum sp.]
MKYQKFNKIDLPNRTWPNNEITKAPVWCSVDLRDGNQALIKPMSLEKKIRFFNLLVEVGFKEIEIGFPSASEVEYEFTRHLIENNLIPDDVTIQVLTQAREHLIKKSAEALRGAKNVIVHLYNPTSTMQREVVYKKSQDEIINIALNGVKWIKEYFDEFEGNVRFEYSPESFTQTELDYAVNISNAVIEAWNPEGDEKMVLNLPSTVESATPNIYADQIEYMSTNIVRRENVLISVHAHNDRGCAVASTELGLMAGADRVEGTLLGNGERTGNVDIITVGLNMYTQGVDPELDFSNVDKIVQVVEEVNEIKTHIRHPYVGELVYTAFSGSHQDAIKKGMNRQEDDALWYVPYLPIDPKDVGRSYESIIQINSQSGKGGVAYILDSVFGYKIPKAMEPYVGKMIQEVSDKFDGVVSEEMIGKHFEKHFMNRKEHYAVKNIDISIQKEETTIEGEFFLGTEQNVCKQKANGIIDAVSSVFESLGVDFKVVDYHEHSLSVGKDAGAVAYFAVKVEDKTYYGAGKGKNISYASIAALVSALNISF